MSATIPSTFTVQELLSHRQWAQRIARQLVGATDADDLVQEGWMAGLVAQPSDRQGLRPWLSTVLGRVAAHRRRGDGRRSAREQVASSPGPEAVPAPEELVAQVEVQRLLAGLVLALEPALRDVILLRFYQGLTSPEIARELGTPEGTVRWRIKSGLEQLRQHLDQRYGGRRDEWLGVLAPIVRLDPDPTQQTDSHQPPSGQRSQSGKPALRGLQLPLVGVALLAVGVLVWTMVPSLTKESGGQAVLPAMREALLPPASKDPAGVGSGSSRGNRLPQLAAVPTSDECRERLAKARHELTANEVEFVQTAGAKAPAALFDHGAVNPVAEAALVPLMTRTLEGAGAAKPAGHTFTCRTLICRLSILVPEDAPVFDWGLLVRRDANLGARLPFSGEPERRPARDAVAGARYREETWYFRLWTPSAEAFSRAKLVEMKGAPAIPLPTFGPLPASLDACRAELSAAENRLATMKTVIERHMLPERRWERSQLNPRLTSEISALARRILRIPAGSRDVTVECRDDICRVDFDRQAFPGPNDWKRIVTPEWKRHARGPESVGGWRAHFTMLASPERAQTSRER